LKKDGLNLDLKSLELIGNYRRTAILDIIDNKRVNVKYINLLEKFKMNQKIGELKE
jgi:hypothetical protein